MERLDEKACRDIRALLKTDSAVFLSDDYPAAVMTGVLRELSALVTSINYFDLSEKGVRKYTGSMVNARILKVYDALWAWGIRKGDRVALTGINSVSYLILEQAIGLLGAVSVPIYYTTPAEETAELLEKSGAGWFFIGDERMMSQLSSIRTKARIVSFSAGKHIERDDVMTFGQFLRHAETHAPKQIPDPGDLATIRYTSGTTGEPKGVMFCFSQLAWMGEVLTNLLTWKDRNRHMVYLSFLPLSHVVEGILASYAPYYVLADVDYYYLNDFNSLAQALPKVRPNVFFSVPRFYEKLWDQVTANFLGKTWMDMKDGPAKQAAGAALKQAVLRKAGLDRCRQLIVAGPQVALGYYGLETLHPAGLPDNLYVADATILPKAMGNPPLLTIMALARKIASIV